MCCSQNALIFLLSINGNQSFFLFNELILINDLLLESISKRISLHKLNVKTVINTMITEYVTNNLEKESI